MLDKTDQAGLGRRLRTMYEAQPQPEMPDALTTLLAKLADGPLADVDPRRAPAEVAPRCARDNVAKALTLFRWRG